MLPRRLALTFNESIFCRVVASLSAATGSRFSASLRFRFNHGDAAGSAATATAKSNQASSGSLRFRIFSLQGCAARCGPTQSSVTAVSTDVAGTRRAGVVPVCIEFTLIRSGLVIFSFSELVASDPKTDATAKRIPHKKSSALGSPLSSAVSLQPQRPRL